MCVCVCMCMYVCIYFLFFLSSIQHRNVIIDHAKNRGFHGTKLDVSKTRNLKYDKILFSLLRITERMKRVLISFLFFFLKFHSQGNFHPLPLLTLSWFEITLISPLLFFFFYFFLFFLSVKNVSGVFYTRLSLF